MFENRNKGINQADVAYFLIWEYLEKNIVKPTPCPTSVTNAKHFEFSLCPNQPNYSAVGEQLRIKTALGHDK